MTTSPLRGDLLGLPVPAEPGALRAAGAGFLTEAFRAAGALPADNAVVAIDSAETVAGGSTGAKMRLSVRYAKPSPELHDSLFVKFSRDFGNEARDNARIQMQREARFALLSRQPGFPITVPVCYYADYHSASGTGVLVTQSIAYGAGVIEPHYPKCLDYRLPDDLPYYRALIACLARLAGYHRAGEFPASVDSDFPFEQDQLTVGASAGLSPDRLAARVERYASFAAEFPGLLPEGIRSAAFLERLRAEARVFLGSASRIGRELAGNPDLVALCHWNANVDNAWFWRDSQGQLQCGLLDWGNVSRMNLGMALWGCLSAAETGLWDGHLDDLLALFVEIYHGACGIELDVRELERHMALYAIHMGIQWLLDVPAFLRRQLPQLPRDADRFHPDISGDETRRARLQMMTVFLNLWRGRELAQFLPPV